MELTDNDKERIEHEIKNLMDKWGGFMPADQMLFKIAEYATIYERGQQAEEPTSGKTIDDKIAEWLDSYAFQVPYDGSNNFYNETKLKHASDGIQWLLPKYKFLQRRVKAIEAERSELVKENEQLKKLLDDCTNNSRL